jgi:hypothetical protein
MQCPRCKQTCYCWYPAGKDELICGCCYSHDRDYEVPICMKYSRDPRKREDGYHE